MFAFVKTNFSMAIRISVDKIWLMDYGPSNMTLCDIHHALRDSVLNIQPNIFCVLPKFTNSQRYTWRKNYKK